MGKLEIYFYNLDTETQRKLLKFHKMESPEEANWDVIPLFVEENIKNNQNKYD